MPITPVSKAQAMRPAEIAAIDALNLAIAQLNELDVSGLNMRLTSIESSITTLNSRVDTLNATITSMQTQIDDMQDDINDIKITLYTPLNQNTDSQGGN